MMKSILIFALLLSASTSYGRTIKCSVVDTYLVKHKHNQIKIDNHPFKNVTRVTGLRTSRISKSYLGGYDADLECIQSGGSFHLNNPSNDLLNKPIGTKWAGHGWKISVTSLMGYTLVYLDR